MFILYNIGVSIVQLWCRRRDLNPHAPEGTSPSSWRVCLFRHSDANFYFSRNRRVNSSDQLGVVGGSTAQIGTWSNKPGTEKLVVTPTRVLVHDKSEGGVTRGRTQYEP